MSLFPWYIGIFIWFFSCIILGRVVLLQWGELTAGRRRGDGLMRLRTSLLFLGISAFITDVITFYYIVCYINECRFVLSPEVLIIVNSSNDLIMATLLWFVYTQWY